MSLKLKRMNGLKSLLKKIVLAPMMILMGNGGADAGSTDDDTGSEVDVDTLREIAGDGPTLSERIMAFAGNPQAQHMQIPPASAGDKAGDADHQGETDESDEEDIDDGLDTGAEEADPDADQEEVDEELDEEGEKKGKGTKQRKLDERIEELVEKRLKERDKAAEAEKPDFIIIDPEKVDARIAEIEAEIDELRLEGKYREARKKSHEIEQLEKDLEENDKRRQAWEEKQKGKKTEESTVEETRKRLDDTAELYRAELKIEVQAWNKMGEWFTAELGRSPLLVKEFNDVFARSGEVAAIRFAHQHAVKNMGKAVKAAHEQREKSKQRSAAVTSATTGNVGPIDLRKVKAAFDANPSTENFQALMAAKRQAAQGAKK